MASSAGIQCGKTGWFETVVKLSPRPRGFHIVTDEILKQVPQVKKFKVGLMHLLLQHTSASLCLNENADPDVRVDMEMIMNKIAPEEAPWVHTMEGPDDMPGHVKSALMGVSHTIPISGGRLKLGTWQGLWLCEHRDRASSRKIAVTIHGCLTDE